jgi:hypothetical protein
MVSMAYRHGRTAGQILRSILRGRRPDLGIDLRPDGAITAVIPRIDCGPGFGNLPAVRFKYRQRTTMVDGGRFK